ncbi:MAG: putative 2-aminoethylphosphonate ABC transporter permease subunit [Rhodospirillaceae bacterium]|nr:putative 2-aminoethylphosphonate ABC transporter permease subunit [Rhodospirillaceae bacterium]
MTTAVLARPARSIGRDELVQRAAILVLIAWLFVTVLLPLWALLSKSFADRAGNWVGLDNYVAYFSTPTLLASLWNSLFVSALTTAIVLPLAFVYAYALTRSRMPAKGVFQAISQVPILAPSLLPAIALVYLFGNQGIFKGWFGEDGIYGWPGIVIAQVFYCFPHALMILITALSTADARLYEAADALGARRWRVFWTVTLPGARYGVVSAGFVVFTLAITDFGIAKVIGGQFNVLATDIYKQVIGQQNFAMGAVVGFVLLAPAVLSFAVDRLVQKKQVALLSARAVPLVPKPRAGRDGAMLLYVAVVGGLLLAILGMALWAPFIQYWPYNLAFTLDNFDFSSFDASGWSPYWVSLKMAAAAAALGTAVVFLGAYVVEKSRGFAFGRGIAHLLAMTPLAVPGLVLGLGYIFFFNARDNPLNFLYGTLAILVVNTVAHFYTVSHLTAVTALKQIDAEFEAVSASLKVPFYVTLFRVTIPICLPAVLDIAIYIFVNAMTTVSAVIFLYGANTKPAAVMIVHMDEAGQIAAAAAMAALIVATSAGVKILHVLLSRWLMARTQAWRRR